MQGVTFLGSLAVGMMLEARAALEKRGRTLRISAPSEAVHIAFALMKLQDVFEEA
jgi:anti-anti-sigma regulatory factor